MSTDRHNRRLPRSTPEAQGIPTSAISAFLDAADQNIRHLHSVMLLRHGHVLAEGWWAPYAPDIPHMLYSLSKSFTSSAVGLAVEEGLLSVNDTVLSFFPDETPESVSENLAAMRVRHLLSMNTGHADDSTPHLRDSEDGNWARVFLARPVEYEPGTYFLYDSGASYMLSAIVQKLTGMKLVEYLQPRLFEPLGIHNPVWDTCPRGINMGGWGLSLTTEDIACFGQMYLQKGVWNGQRILPESWVELATAYHSDNSRNDEVDWQQGYGFQFWRCQHNAYRGDGAFGQFCVVMPEQDAVFVATSGVERMQSVLDLIWEILLPSMAEGTLEENAQESAQLRERMANLELTAPQAAPSSPRERDLSGRTYEFEQAGEGIRSLALRFAEDVCVLTVGNERGQHEIEAARGAWKTGSTSLETEAPARVAASSTWLDDDTLAVRIRFYETPHEFTYTCRFTDDGVELDRQLNLSLGPAEFPCLRGRAV